MGVLIPVGFGNARFEFSLAGDPEIMSFSIGYDYPGGADPVANATTILGFFTGSGRPFLPANFLTGYQFIGVECSEQTEDGILAGRASVLSSGTLSGSPLPQNCSFLFTKRTALGGRKNKGRFFLPPISMGEALVSATGVLDSTSQAAVQGFWNAAMNAWIASALPPVLLHSAAGLPTPIVGVTLQSIIATQRKRLR